MVHLLKEARGESNRYKFAVSCIKFSKYKEAERALLGADPLKGKNFDNVANGSYGLYLLGVVCEKQIRYADAKEYYSKALELNPTLWSAYEKLGKLGEQVNPGKVFSDTRHKNYEAAALKKPSTPVSLKRKKEEEERVKKPVTQAPKRKNSIHSADNASNARSI